MAWNTVATMVGRRARWLAVLVVVPLVWGIPLTHDIDRGPFAAVSDISSAVSDLNSRVASRASLLQSDRDPRLPLHSAQDLETIKKVAQILIMLGEQVLPSVFVERPSKPLPPTCEPAQEVPNDPFNDKLMLDFIA